MVFDPEDLRLAHNQDVIERRIMAAVLRQYETAPTMLPPQIEMLCQQLAVVKVERQALKRR